MRSADVLRLALTALWQRKLRTALTLLGVLFGTFVLVASLSLGKGVQDTIVREYARFNELRHIEVRPDYGRVEMEDALTEDGMAGLEEAGPERRQRLREALAQRWQNRRGTLRRPLTPERVEELRQLQGVEWVRPEIRIGGRAILGKRAEDTLITAADFGSDRLRGRLVAGRLPGPGEDKGAVLTETLLFFLGLRSDAEVERALGKKVRVESRAGGRSPHLLLLLLQADTTGVGLDDEKVLDKALAQLPDAIARMDLSLEEKATLQRLLSRRPKSTPRQEPETAISEEYTLLGVLRAPTTEEQMRDWRLAEADVFLTQGAAEELFLRAPQARNLGFNSATVTAERLEDVKPLTEAIHRMGLEAFAMLERVERERFIYLLVFGGMTCIAVIALLVAALGITNTMLIGVLERTREIGILKAVGARDGTIVLMFLVEGALVGLVGGLLGLLLTRLASVPGDAWVRSMVNRQLTLKLEESLFAFPWWLTTGAPLFATVVTTLAAVLPARRASRVNPVEALRHE